VASSRPTDDELIALSNLLLDGQADLDPRVLGILSNSDSKTLLDRLDYHGITLLAEQNARLPTQLTESVKQRKAMMIANEALKKQRAAPWLIPYTQSLGYGHARTPM